MNLAFRDIRHHLGRFLLTCFGLSLLLGVVLSMIGIYRGLVDDALTLVRQAFGEDAVVLSTTPCAEGVEVLAMAPEGMAHIEKLSTTAPRVSSKVTLTKINMVKF